MKRIKKNIFGLILVGSLFYANTYFALGPLTQLFDVEKLAEVKTFDIQIQKEIEGLRKRKANQQELHVTHKLELKKVQDTLESLKKKSKEEVIDKEFINKKIFIFNQILQVLTEIDQVHNQIIGLIDSNIEMLRDYKDDPEFKEKSLRLPSKSIYSVEDLQKVNDLFVQHEKSIKEVEERLKKASDDLEFRKKTVSLAKREYEEKVREQKELKSKDIDSEVIKENQNVDSFTLAQKGEIVDAEAKLLKFKFDLSELRFIEQEQKIHLIKSELKILKIQSEIIQNQYEQLKGQLYVDEKDINKSVELLKKQVAEASRKQEEVKKKIDSIEESKLKEQDKITDLKKKYEISDADLVEIKNWSFEPKDTEKWQSLISIGKISDYITYELDVNKDDLFAQIEYSKAKVTEKEVDNALINSWYKLTSGKTGNSIQEEIKKDINNYEKIKVDIQSQISATSDRHSAAVNKLNIHGNVVENIKSRLEELKNQKNSTFKNNAKEYNRLSVQLKDEIYDVSPKRGEGLARLIDNYISTNNLRKKLLHKIDAIVEELNAKLKWVGVPVIWKGIRSFLPEVKRFFKFIYSKSPWEAVKSNKEAFVNLANYYKENIFALISVILQLTIFIIIFFLIWLFLPDIIQFFVLIGPEYGVLGLLSNFFVTTLAFLGNRLLGIFIWSLLFLSVRNEFISDKFTGVIFYLLSIIFWSWIVHQYVRFIEKRNADKEYFLISKEYQKRFFTVLSLFLYSTIIIFFFREAFLLASPVKSEVPTILNALNFIIFQIALICILSKEQILNLIPKGTAFGKWVYEQIEQYYYLFLAAIITLIVLSNPYFGFGLYFFYIISRLILILLLIPIFMVIHNKVKDLFSIAFFSSDGETIKERIPYGRSLYGLSVITSFLFFLFLLILIGVNIWGYKVGFTKLYEWINTEIYPYQDADTGKRISVSVIDFGWVFIYVLIGIVVAYLINRFILGRMFELLLVNVGIQNAVLTLAKYSIIFGSMIIGLRSIGMGSVLIYVLAIVGGLGVAGKELITDVMGYFIILIQGPLKIGDFVKLDEEVTGVVRHITLRSVILRRKNSVTVIVPNSQVMSRSLINWNYSRSYFAFDDIPLTVPYTSDPEKVKELIFSVLDNNIYILKNPAPIVWLINFTDNGFQFSVRGYLSFDKVLDQWQIASDVRIELVRVLREHGIKVASPTRVLRVIRDTKEETQ